MYEPRTYRHGVKHTDLVSFEVIIKQSDLFISASRNLKDKASRILAKYRGMIEKYAARYPLFLSTLEPYVVAEDAPLIVRDMAQAGALAGVGPMASVAGAIAEAVGRELLDFSPDIIVENGGDVFLKTTRRRLVGIYAGTSSLSGRLALEIKPEDTPVGVCTSSGTVGHSLSFGAADAVITVAPSASLADAAATAVSNRVKTVADFPAAIEFGQTIPGLAGLVIIKGDQLGLWGEVTLAPV
ncbi:MAG: UPF0280 family protein [Chloroflexota bacterium]